MKQDHKVWDWRTYILKHGPDNSTYRHLLLTLSCYMDSAGGSCFPSVDTLIKDSCLSKPTVIKYLKKADLDGWIKKSVHGYSGQGWKRHEYTANLPEKVVKEVNRLSEKVVKQVNQGGKPRDEKVVKQVNPISPYNSSTNSGEKTHSKDFEIPAVLSVINYFQELGRTATMARDFYDHYEANGWKVGKNPMQNWKAAARRWVNKEPHFNKDSFNGSYTYEKMIDLVTGHGGLTTDDFKQVEQNGEKRWIKK